MNSPQMSQTSNLNLHTMEISSLGESAVYPQPVGSSSLGRKSAIHYSGEPLTLLCEWESCSILKRDIDSFISHILKVHITDLDGNDLHCHWKDCEGFTENISELKRHILLHAFHAKIKCYGANLLSRKKLPNCLSSIQTRNIIPELPDPLLCCWHDCQVVYECPEYFYRHVDSHAEHDSTKDKVSTCLWQDCNRTFNNQCKVKEHLRSHTQEKLIACPTCGGMFASRTKFFDHIQRQLPESIETKEVFSCDYCSRKLSTDRLLRDHMRRHVNHYKCPYCDMTCPTPSGIATHVAYRHSEEKPHACQYCDYRCKTESDLRKHLESHSMVPTYKCPVENCSYASRSQSCYRAHYRKKHEGKQPVKYACHLCEKMFSRGNYLTKHLLNHHKFKWPSGHCRFRYCLNDEGIYRLQTVRYESLELTQEMMGESPEIIGDDSEDVDDPNYLVNSSVPSNEYVEVIPKVDTNSQIPKSIILHTSNLNSNSLLLSVEAGKGEIRDGVLVNTQFYLANERASSNEPVLIKIVDSVNNYGNQSMTVDFGEASKEQHTAVQSITKDSEGRMVFETIEIATEDVSLSINSTAVES